jgi:hypothetical protein
MRRTLALLTLQAFLASVLAQNSPERRDPRPGDSGSADARPAKPPARNVHRLLAQRVPEVTFDETPLEAWLEWLRDTAQINVVAQWERLAEVGVQRDHPIVLRARNLRLGQLIWLVLQQCETTGDVRLGYRVDADLMVITTVQDLDREMVIRVYDVQDLLAARLRNPSITVGRQHEFVTGLVPSVAAGAVGVRPVTQRWLSGCFLEGGDGGGDVYADDESGYDPDRTLRELIGVILTTVEPDSWAVSGGAGSIEPFRGRLVVRNTPRVHQLLAGPLGDAMSP